MISEMSEITGARFGATRQICRSLRYSAITMALKHGLALLDESLGRFLVISGLAGTRMMDRLTVEAGLQRHCFGIVDVALDVAQRHRRPLRQRHREIARLG